MKNKRLQIVKELAILGSIVYFLKMSVLGAFLVPTGSMENTILPGDFLFGNQIIYGMRTPDWIGIPWSDIGFDLPSYRFPALKKIDQGDIVIFKFPRDKETLYVKRCIAGPGDSLEIRARRVYVNGIEFSLPPHGKFTDRMMPENYRQQDIFLINKSNKDFFGPVRIPKKGDVIELNKDSDWKITLQLVILDGHKVTIKKGSIEYTKLTVMDPREVYRRKESASIFKDFNHGKLINPWDPRLTNDFYQYIYIDDKPITGIKSYIVEQDYFWMMGDNRDHSLDSRFWGFVPRRYIKGRALLTFMSIDFNKWMLRFNRFATILR
jgi:signal peptidase I